MLSRKIAAKRLSVKNPGPSSQTPGECLTGCGFRYPRQSGRNTPGQIYTAGSAIEWPASSWLHSFTFAAPRNDIGLPSQQPRTEDGTGERAQHDGAAVPEGDERQRIGGAVQGVASGA